MERRTLLLVAAFVVAALGTTLVFLYVNGANDRALADQRPVTVLVAAKDIPAGTTVADAEAKVLFAPKAISQDSVIDGALGSPVTIRDKVALAPIYRGQQLIPRQFGDTSRTSPLLVPDGSIAVSVDVPESNRLGQFLTPGSLVAVFVTGSSGGPPRTTLLLSRVQVIANGANTLTSPPSDSASQGSGLLTFAVDQKQAQKLIAGAKGGDLYFALLTKGAKTDVTDPGVSLNQIAP
jgi:pilus assembly protein CpaB